MAIATGTKLGPYEIVGPLGAGGMGEVYRARDTRLGREVAVKVLPAHLSSDAGLKARFEREAKSISGLNHPNICVLHDVGSQDGVDYLVMELVAGETLAARLEKGPIVVERVLKIGREIAEALDKAHRSGIIHRDLKPGNIMLTKSGAKLMDFGLARPAVAGTSLATLTGVAAVSAPVTQQGMIVGTFQYMSPEQVEGKELDGRSDIFSLGAVLYEMVTGRRAFEGKSQLSVATAILEKDPVSIGTVKPLIPANLGHAVRRCLAKDPDERWQTARDLAIELKWAGESGSPAALPAASGVSKKKVVGIWLAWALAGAVALGLLAGAAIWKGKSGEQGTMYFAGPFQARDMAVAPNGHTVAVASEDESGRKIVLWLYEVGARGAKSLADTEGASFPFWSPDGKYLAFFAAGKLKKLSVTDGDVQALCDAPTGRGGTWNKDGVIVFTPSGQVDDGLYRVSASGGKPTRISSPDKSRGETSHRWPQFLPDGKHYLYLAFNVSWQKANAIYVGALDSSEKKLVTEATANGAYAAPGYLLYYRDDTLFAQRFDARNFELSGEATPVLKDIQFLPRIARATFAAVDNRLLVAQNSVGVSLSRLVWFDRLGNELKAVGLPDVYANVSLAPNGKSVAVDKTDPGSRNADVWIYDFEGGNTKRMTFDPGVDAMPVWSPDGRQLIFSSSRQHSFDLYLKDANGAVEEKLIEHTDVDRYPCDWSRDGKHVLNVRGADLWVMSAPEFKNSPFLKAPSTIKNGQFSPDGKWVAYASNESGKWEVYVTSFPEAKGKWQVSNGGGEQPRWRGDGKELFFLSADGKMLAAPVKLGTNFDTGTPAVLFQANAREMVATSEQIMYDVSADGQRFLINTQVKNAEARPMSVVLNWAEKK
jgi:eukaryotic-like serine/threonine-protein kinase